LRGYGTLFQLSGHEGEPLKVRLELDKFDSQEKVAPAPIKNIYQAIIEEHAKSVASKRAINAKDGLHNLKLCEAAHESARSGGKTIEVK